jgi:hypothetical protein
MLKGPSLSWVGFDLSTKISHLHLSTCSFRQKTRSVLMCLARIDPSSFVLNTWRMRKYVCSLRVRVRVLRKNILAPVSFLCEINVFLLPFRRGASAELDSSEHHDTQVSIQDDRSSGFLSCSEQGAGVVRYRKLV